KEVTQFGQNRVFKNILGVTHRPGRLFSADFFEIVADSFGNAVWATACHPHIGKSVAFGPPSDGLLGLPIVQDFYLVGLSRIVRSPKGMGFIRAVAEIAPTDPSSRGGATVIAKTQTLGDFHEVGRPAYLQACSSSAGFQMGVAG